MHSCLLLINTLHAKRFLHEKHLSIVHHPIALLMTPTAAAAINTTPTHPYAHNLLPLGFPMFDSLPVGVKLVGVSTDAVPVVSGPVAIIDGIAVADHQEAAYLGVGYDSLPAAQQPVFILSHAHTSIGRISTTAFPSFTTSPRVM